MVRDAERLRRERQIEQALADFFLNTDRVQEILTHAQQRADRILADGQTAAREPFQLALAALRYLVELGETRHAISELTGLSLAQLREMLTDPPAAGDSAPEPADAGSGQAGEGGGAAVAGQRPASAGGVG